MTRERGRMNMKGKGEKRKHQPVRHRNEFVVIVLFTVTLGAYLFYWFFSTWSELHRSRFLKPSTSFLALLHLPGIVSVFTLIMVALSRLEVLTIVSVDPERDWSIFLVIIIPSAVLFVVTTHVMFVMHSLAIKRMSGGRQSALLLLFFWFVCPWASLALAQQTLNAFAEGQDQQTLNAFAEGQGQAARP